MKFCFKKFSFVFFFPTLLKPNIIIWRLLILFFPPHFWRLKISKITSFSILFLISFFGETERWLGWDSRNPCVAGVCVRACLLARALPLQSSARRSTRTRRRRRKGKERRRRTTTTTIREALALLQWVVVLV